MANVIDMLHFRVDFALVTRKMMAIKMIQSYPVPAGR